MSEKHGEVRGGFDESQELPVFTFRYGEVRNEQWRRGSRGYSEESIVLDIGLDQSIGTQEQRDLLVRAIEDIEGRNKILRVVNTFVTTASTEAVSALRSKADKIVAVLNEPDFQRDVLQAYKAKERARKRLKNADSDYFY